MSERLKIERRAAAADLSLERPILVLREELLGSLDRRELRTWVLSGDRQLRSGLTRDSNWLTVLPAASSRQSTALSTLRSSE